NDPARIDHEHIRALQAQMHQQVQAGNGGGACARTHQFDVADIFAHDLQAVQDGGSRNNGRAVLVVVKHRDLHAFTQFFLDVETLGGFDVFKVHAAQRGLQGGDDVHQLVGVCFGQFDVEHIDAGKFLEQAALAFHDRLGGQRADIAQAEHGGSVGDDAHQIRA